MKIRGRILLFVAAMLALMVSLESTLALAENIDTNNDGSQFAWSENGGWIDFEPSLGPGVTVSALALTGYAWGENLGWISLSCDGTGTCGQESYGVTNDSTGGLAGYAWGENTGWISFSCANTASCGTVDYGVTISTAGEFSGYAWSENIGWISFSCENTSSCGSENYRVTTNWRHAVGGTTSFSADGSGPSAGGIALLVSGIAVVVAIGAAGGWYTRRRWLGSRS